MTCFYTQIDSVEVKVSVGLNIVDKLVQLTPVRVRVEFEFEPGIKPVIVADPAHSDPGCTPYVRILRVINLAPLELHGDDVPPMIVSANGNIRDFLPKAEIERLEEEAFDVMVAEVEP